MDNIEVTLARYEERIDNLEEYRRRQNGSIQRIEDEIRGMYRWLLGLVASVALDLLFRLITTFQP